MLLHKSFAVKWLRKEHPLFQTRCCLEEMKLKSRIEKTVCLWTVKNGF